MSASSCGSSPARTRIWISRGVIRGSPGNRLVAGLLALGGGVAEGVAQRLVDCELELLVTVGGGEHD